MSFDGVYSMARPYNQTVNYSSISDSPAPCSYYNPNAKIYTTSKSMDYISGSITEAVTYVEVSLTYDSSGVISGSLSVSGSFDASFYTPSFSADQIVTDTVSFTGNLLYHRALPLLQHTPIRNGTRNLHSKSISHSDPTLVCVTYSSPVPHIMWLTSACK